MQVIYYLVFFLLRVTGNNISNITNNLSVNDESHVNSSVIEDGMSENSNKSLGNGNLNLSTSEIDSGTVETKSLKISLSNLNDSSIHGNDIDLQMSTIISHNHIKNQSQSIDSNWNNKVTIVCVFKNRQNESITLFAEQLSGLDDKFFSSAGFHRRMKNICEEIELENMIFMGNYKNIVIEKLREYYTAEDEEMQYLTSIFYRTFPFSGCLTNASCQVFYEKKLNNIQIISTQMSNISETSVQNDPKRLNNDTFIFCLGQQKPDSALNVKQLNLEEIHSMYRQYFDDLYFIKSLGILLFISAFFMLVTALIYCLLPELRFNVYGKCVIFYLATTTVAYSCFGSRLTFPGQLGPFCQFTGFMFQFSWIASFAWQSVMCLDILLALSVLRWKVIESRSDQINKLLVYSSYAYGLPALISGTTYVLQYTSVLSEDSDWKPNIGGRFCFFQHADGEGRKLRWLYFCGPFSVIIVTNFIMFVATAIFIQKHSRTVSTLNGSNSRRCSNKNPDNEMFQVHLTLFFVMGTNWLLEVVTLIKDNADITSGWLFRAIDYFNASIGMVLFIVLVCKDKVMSGLRNQLAYMRTAKQKSINSVTTTPDTDNISLPSVIADPSTSCQTNLSSSIYLD